MASHYQLSVPNVPASVAVAEAFVRRVGAAFGLDAEQLELVSDAAALAVDYTIQFSYPEARADQISLEMWPESGELHVLVQDNGLPQLPGSSPDPPRLSFEQKLTDALSKLHYQWRLLGYGGRELEFSLAMAGEAVFDNISRVGMAQAEPVGAEQYVIRRLDPREAQQVTRLVYRVYGHSYDDEDYYFPDRIVAENETGAMVSIVAVHPSGEVVGHYALEQREPPTIYEGSSAVVNPVHRGKGLMERMRSFAMEEGKRLELDGLYFLPWTIHTLSQHANEHFGAKLCAINLSDTSPVALEGFESESLAQRVSTVLYFVPLQDLEPLEVHLPERHKAMLSKIYALLGRPISPPSSSTPSPPSSTYTVNHLPHDKFAEIIFEQVGEDAAHVLGHETREQIVHHQCETVYLNLPLSQATTPAICEAVEQLGYSFLGLGPCFAADGDMLRMGLLTQRLDPAHIHVLSDFGQRLLEYCLSEADRVDALS